jgi:WD40-like Beta Propeller Repeat
MWVGRDEHEGVRAQPRKDLEPPPHWRLDAIARTPRPRSLHVVGGRAVFIEDRGTSDLWLLELEDGAVPRRLTTGREPMPYWEDTHPRLSPDGTRVAYADGDHVWLVPTAGGPPRKLVEGASPVWIDDARLVIAVERDDTTRLALVDADDAWPRRLAIEHGDLDAYGDEGEAAVSPDRTQVAYTFTPRGDLNRSEIRVAALDGGAVRALTGTPRMHDATPAWSPDGARVAYLSERSGFTEVHLAGAEDRQLTSAGADHSEHAWHPDGTRLLAVRCRRNRFELVDVDARSGEAKTVAEGGTWSHPHWTPDDGIVGAYSDHATPPELRTASGAVGASTSGAQPATRGASAPDYAARPLHAAAPLSVRRAPHAPLEDVSFTSFDGLEIPRIPAAPAARDRPRPRRRLPPRRPDRRLHRRLGRPRAVLRREGLRVAGGELPRLDRLRARLRARQPRRLGRRRHEGLPCGGGSPQDAGLGRRRAPGDLRRQLRLVHGGAGSHRRPRAPLPLRDHQVRRLRHRHLVGVGRPRRRAGPRADDGPAVGRARGLPGRLRGAAR